MTHHLKTKPETLKYYRSEFTSRCLETSDTSFQTAAALHNAWIELDTETSKVLINKLIKLVPLGSYWACKHFGFAGSDHLDNPNSNSATLLSQHLTVLFASLVSKPKKSALKAWLRLAESYDAYVCELCQGVFEREHMLLH